MAFDTDQNGTEVAGPVALADDGDRERIVDDLADVLGQSYDSVEREGGTLVARETAFDPALARELGVPEGPKFGQLSAGRAVEIDGEEITPDEVTRQQTDEFPVRNR